MIDRGHSHLDEAKSVLERGLCDIDEQAAPMTASRAGLLEGVQLLIEKGADLDAQGNGGQTALHIAANCRHFDVTKALLDAGASVTKRLVDGRTPLHLASEHGEVPIMELLIDAGSEAGAESVLKYVPLDVAAFGGHSNAVRFIVSRVGLAACGGQTGGVKALEWAAQCGHIEVLRVLSDFGVQDNGRALVYSVDRAKHECIQLLLRQYAKHSLSHVNTTFVEGRTAMMCSARGSPKVVQWLIQAGASVHGVHVPYTTVLNALVETAETKEDKKRLEAIRRTLLREPAIRSSSWAWWQGDIAATVPVATTAAAHTSTSTRASAASATRRLKIVRRGRRETSHVVLGGLMR